MANRDHLLDLISSMPAEIARATLSRLVQGNDVKLDDVAEAITHVTGATR